MIVSTFIIVVAAAAVIAGTVAAIAIVQCRRRVVALEDELRLVIDAAGLLLDAHDDRIARTQATIVTLATVTSRGFAALGVRDVQRDRLTRALLAQFRPATKH